MIKTSAAKRTWRPRSLPPADYWANYQPGVVAQLQGRSAAPPGFNCVFGGDVPPGAGLSSAAAVECGLAFAFYRRGL